MNVLHALWTAEEKEPFEAMARADMKRYREAMAGYKSGASAMNIDSGNESDSGWCLVQASVGMFWG